MNPSQKMTKREIQQYAYRFFHHNADTLEDLSMRRLRFIDHDEDKRLMMDEDGN